MNWNKFSYCIVYNEPANHLLYLKRCSKCRKKYLNVKRASINHNHNHNHNDDKKYKCHKCKSVIDQYETFFFLNTAYCALCYVLLTM
jgi:late competence protein required for DNA uptake (superfamily II DNA/RNA helicase)